MQDSVDLRTLFWRTTPISLKRGDRDESIVELNVRVLAGYSGGSEVLKLVRIYISNDNDLSFLYSLDILEQHYGRVREDEHLLVDFSGFAEKVGWLLQQCCTDTATEASYQQQNSPSFASTASLPSPPPSKFRAILQVAGANSGALKLVESNTFKDLPHLTLQLRGGTDASIKQFLSFRLGEVKADCTRLNAALHQGQAAKAALESELRACQAASSSSTQAHQDQHRKHEATISDLHARIDAAEASVALLTEHLATARASHAASHERAIAAETEATHLKRTSSEVVVQLAERVTQLQEATTRAEAAESAASHVAQRCQGFEAALKQAESRIAEWKDIASGNEARAAALASDVTSLRERCAATGQDHQALLHQLQEKSDSLAKLVGEASEVKYALEDAEKRASSAQERLTAAESAEKTAQAAAAASAAEVEEMKKKVQSNDKMIAWLNKQLTAAQLQAGNVARPRGTTSSSSGGGTATTTTTLMPLTPGKPWLSMSAGEHSAASLDRQYFSPLPAQKKESFTAMKKVSTPSPIISTTTTDSGPQPRPPLPSTALLFTS